MTDLPADCGCTSDTKCYANSLADGDPLAPPPPDCGCTPRTDYTAGYGWLETHEHDVRGSEACATCAEPGACGAYTRLRAKRAQWIAAYLGTAS